MTQEIFVFGSNLQGKHGKGAALHARQEHGAIYGKGEGLQGNSYAIPTKGTPYKTMPLNFISRNVRTFLKFAAAHPEMTFNVTAIGTGLAGYDHGQIAPMFAGAPANCVMPEEWRELLA